MHFTSWPYRTRLRTSCFPINSDDSCGGWSNYFVFISRDESWASSARLISVRSQQKSFVASENHVEDGERTQNLHICIFYSQRTRKENLFFLAPAARSINFPKSLRGRRFCTFQRGEQKFSRAVQSRSTKKSCRECGDWGNRGQDHSLQHGIETTILRLAEVNKSLASRREDDRELHFLRRLAFCWLLKQFLRPFLLCGGVHSIKGQHVGCFRSMCHMFQLFFVLNSRPNVFVHDDIRDEREMSEDEISNDREFSSPIVSSWSPARDYQRAMERGVGKGRCYHLENFRLGSFRSVWNWSECGEIPRCVMWSRLAQMSKWRWLCSWCKSSDVVVIWKRNEKKVLLKLK